MATWSNAERMRAIVYDRYGPPEVLRLEEVARPVPKDDEVLIKVSAAAVNRNDTGLRSAEYFISRFLTGLVRPKRKLRIPGTELSGVVEATGPAVGGFAVGDEVFGVSAKTAGAHAEFVCLPEKAPLAHKPDGMSFVDAAAVCDGAILALAYLKKLQLGPGSKVMVYGASGSIGTAAVQLAKHLGADVTAVCNTENVDVVASLGPDRVIDYTKDEFMPRGATYHLFFDAVGKLSFRQCRPSLTPNGAYASTDLGPKNQNPFLALSTRFGKQRVLFPIPRYTKEDVLFVKGLVEAGAFRAVVDRTYPLERVVEASHYVETGRKTGNVVLTIAAPDSSPG